VGVVGPVGRAGTATVRTPGDPIGHPVDPPLADPTEQA
jgi:hypothetical protein